MTITRTTLVGGPAAAIFGGQTFFAQEGIVISPALELAEVISDANGLLDETVVNAPVTIRLAPSAPAANLAALFPHLAAQAGSSLFGSVDTPLEIIGANGVRLTFPSVAVITMPDLTLGARGPVTGTVTFLALGANGAAAQAADRVVTLDLASMPEVPSGSPLLCDDYTVSWGSASPWLGLRSRDGVRVAFEMETKPVRSDANALVDLTLEKLTVEVRFAPSTPGGPAEADALAGLVLEGAGSLPGHALSAQAAELVITGTTLSLNVAVAELVRAELVFDAKRPRFGELTFRGTGAELIF